MTIMDFRKILEIIAGAAKRKETVEIYYPSTTNTPEGWREVEPYSLTTDVGETGEHLIYGKDQLRPGHIFNGYTVRVVGDLALRDHPTVESEDKHCDSFIIGKIKRARSTGRKFAPRNNWKVEI